MGSASTAFRRSNRRQQSLRSWRPISTPKISSSMTRSTASRGPTRSASWIGTRWPIAELREIAAEVASAASQLGSQDLVQLADLAQPAAEVPVDAAFEQPNIAATETLVVNDEFVFRPPTLVVAPGTTVVFLNAEAPKHTVTADAQSFDSGSMAEGDTSRVTFSEAGESAYFCKFHGDRGAVGMAASAPSASPAAAAVPPAHLRSQTRHTR